MKRTFWTQMISTLGVSTSSNTQWKQQHPLNKIIGKTERHAHTKVTVENDDNGKGCTMLVTLLCICLLEQNAKTVFSPIEDNCLESVYIPQRQGWVKLLDSSGIFPSVLRRNYVLISKSNYMGTSKREDQKPRQLSNLKGEQLELLGVKDSAGNFVMKVCLNHRILTINLSAQPRNLRGKIRKIYNTE